MIREGRIAAILNEAETLNEAVDRLVAEANEAGGRDNITVVAFRVDDAEMLATPEDQHTLVGPAAEEAGLTAAGVEAAAERRTPTGERDVRPAARAPRERRWPRRTAKVLAVAVATVGLAALAVWGVRQIYFLGTDSGGRLALYRGLPYELPLGIDLYSEVYAAPVQVESIPASRRESATDHTLRFHDDAASLVEDLQTAAERRTRSQAAGNQQPGGTGAGKQPGGRERSNGGGSANGGGGGGGGSGGGSKNTGGAG